MPYEYLYVDDEGGDKVESYVDGLSKDGIVVEYKHVNDKFNTDYIKKNLVNYDGILLDLRLDDTPDSSDFTASEFAQHIRTLVTKGDLKKDLPIVLFSTDEKLQKVYSIDLSSHNLFDAYIQKVNTPDNASKDLFALAKGYREIEKSKNNLEKLIGLEDLYDLNGEIFARFLVENINIPAHEYAQVILKDLIYVTGVLINENVLAARLGTDKEKSADWKQVKDIFEFAKYKGVFCDGWNRWWEHEINNIFKQEFQINQSYLNADEKCQLFKDRGINNIISPKPIKFNSSNRFTTVCKVLNQPLDSLEGYRTYSSKPLKQWQEYDYVSLNAFAEKLNESKNIRVHPDDKDSLINAMADLN